MEHDPIVIERVINAPATKVWKALTDISELRQWNHFIFGALDDFKAEPGFAFQFLLGPGDQQFKHFCEVTTVEENRKLAYSWRYDGYEGTSLITYELIPEGDMTHLVMTWEGTHSFPANVFQPEGFKQGATITMDALHSFTEKSTVS